MVRIDGVEERLDRAKASYKMCSWDVPFGDDDDKTVLDAKPVAISQR